MCSVCGGGLLVTFKLTTKVILVIFAVAGCSTSSKKSSAPVRAFDIRLLKINQRSLEHGYLVQADDTLFSIAFRSYKDVSQLARINDLKAPYRLVPGQVIRLDTTDEYQDQYRVRQGDSLSKIASHFSMSVDQLARINRIQAPYTITQGKRFL